VAPNGLVGAVVAICLAVPARAQSVQAFDATRPSAQITSLLAQRNIDAAVAAAAPLMPGTTADKLRDAFGPAREFGQSHYIDLVYARDYGRSGKDLIFKIDYDRAFMYVRFIYHVNNGAWQLIHIYLKAENDLPFPKDWTHIYPQ
jgi:hypothetical protein